MSALSDTYAKARSEIIALFGWNAEGLTADQTLRLDCAVALRLALDDLQGRVVRGETVDVAKMLSAADALSRLVPAAALAAPPPASNAPDPRAAMWATYKQMRDRGAQFGQGYDGLKLENERLKAKVAELESALAVSGASTDAPAPAGGNVVSLRPSPTTDRSVVPSAPPPAAPAAPAAPATGLLTDDEPEPWRPFVTDGAFYERWINRN
jgi:hypothetical protein